MSAERALLPCPFCGVTPDVHDPATFQANQGDKWGFVVCCCQGPEVRTSYRPVEHWRDNAIKEWNRRVPQPDREVKDARRYRAILEMTNKGSAFGLMLNANDTFAYACADAVTAETGNEIESVVSAYLLAGHDGVMAWMERKERRKVIKEHREAADRGHAALEREARG